MKQYIDKDALVAEIRRMIKNSELYIEHHRDNNDRLCYSFEHQRLAMCELLSFIDALEVKEVDLEKELSYDNYDKFFKEHPNYNDIDWGFDECWVFAKYFFELGLKASQKGE